MEFFLYDRWDNRIRVLDDIIGAVHAQELNKEESLTLTTRIPLNKGERVVWRDGYGIWHEHVVDDPQDSREDGGAVCTSYCEDAMNEVRKDIVGDKRPRNASAAAAIDAVIATTRWKAGTVDVAGTASPTFYRCSVGEAFEKVVEVYGGELYPSYDVDGYGVVSRTVNLVTRRGGDFGKRFEYAKDLVGVTRRVLPGDICSAMRGFGKGEEVGDGYGRRIDFAAINGGKDYVEDTDARLLWGRPDGDGGIAHAFGTAIFEDCEDPAELLELTRGALEEAKVPKVSYSASVIDLKAAGFDHEGVGIGDTVAIIDRGFEPALRLSGRVTRIERDLFDPSGTKVTVGNIVGDIASSLAAAMKSIESMRTRSAAWDVAAYTPEAYLQQIIDGLNAQFDAAGNYRFESFGKGEIWSTVPMDDKGDPIAAGGSAMQLTGLGFRIASERNPDGTWRWRTFGTGSGFTADEINAGTIKGGSNLWNLGTGDLLFKQGSIASADGKNSWNLTSGDFKVTDGTIELSGSISGQPFRLTISPSTGIQLYQGQTLIGGMVYQNGKLVFRAASVGTDGTFVDFSTAGTTHSMSFYINGEERFRVSNGVRITPQGSTQGVTLMNPRNISAHIILLDNGQTYINNLVT